MPLDLLLVDSREAARMLSISARTLWTFTAKGEIPCVRIGKAVRYSVDDLRAWIERSRSAAPQRERYPQPVA